MGRSLTPRLLERDPSPHPGKELRRLLDDYQLTQRQLAAHLGLNVDRITGVINGYMPVSNELALLLSQVFPFSAQYWVQAQASYDLDQTFLLLQSQGRLRTLVPFLKPIDRSMPTPFDKCMCGHWGWEHIDFPEGGCIASECHCPLYMRLGGYLVAAGADKGIKGLSDEERKRIIDSALGNNGGLPELSGDGYGGAEADGAGDDVPAEVRQTFADNQRDPE
jgi:addiction module HigA family antidote